MSKTIITMIFLCGFASAQTSGSTQSLLITADNLQKRFLAYEQDFTDFAKNKDGLEYDIPYNLGMDAGSMGERLDALSNLLVISSAMSCNEDRVQVDNLIRREVPYYQKLFDNSIKAVNLGLGFLHQPAVASEGTRMRDDIRAAGALLDDILLALKR